MNTALYAVGMLAAHGMTFLGGLVVGWCLRGRAGG